MSNIQFLGYVATVITIIAFIPQVWRVWRLRETRDISLATFTLLLAGALSWLTYGILLSSLPIILTNATLAFFQTTIIVFKLKYG